MRVKINSTGEIKEVKQVGDKLFDKENNWYSLSQVILLDDWRPASELPILKDGEDDVDFIVICDGYGIRLPFHATYCKYTGWSHDNIKWWCYPPEED